MGEPIQSTDLEGRVDIEPVSVPAVVEICEFIRDTDRAEVYANGYDDVLDGVWTSVVQSEQAYVVSFEGAPSFVFGVSIQNDNSGYVWAVGTDDVNKFSILFARESRKWMNQLSEGRSYLWTRSFMGNPVHHRWLEWCGFDFVMASAQPPHGLQFKTYARPCA